MLTEDEADAEAEAEAEAEAYAEAEAVAEAEVNAEAVADAEADGDDGGDDDMPAPGVRDSSSSFNLSDGSSLFEVEGVDYSFLRSVLASPPGHSIRRYR